MVVTDPIADMLTRIRNAITAKHADVEMPASKAKKAIAQILLDEGYIAGYEEIANELLYVCQFGKKKFVVMLQTPAKLNVGEKVKVNSVINGVAIGLPEDGRIDFISSDNQQGRK